MHFRYFDYFIFSTAYYRVSLHFKRKSLDLLCVWFNANLFCHDLVD